jgi:hypothetical protein
MKTDTFSVPADVVMFEGGQRCELRATFCYDRNEPHEVQILFPPGSEHLDLIFARELLVGTAIRPAGDGAVRVWTSERGLTACIDAAARDEPTWFEVPAEIVICFLDMTYRLVPEATEPPRADIDAGIAAILAGGAS